MNAETVDKILFNKRRAVLLTTELNKIMIDPLKRAKTDVFTYETMNYSMGHLGINWKIIVNKGFSSPNVSIRSILTPKKVVKLKTLGNPLFLGQTFFGGCARGRKIEKFPVVEFSHILCLTRGFWTL